MATQGCFNFIISHVKRTDSAEDGVIDWLELCGSCTGFSFISIFVGLSAGGTSSPPTLPTKPAITITISPANFQALLNCLDGHPSDALVTICYKETNGSIVVYSITCGSASLVFTQVLRAVQAIGSDVRELNKVVSEEILPRVISGERSLKDILEVASQLRKVN